jgi:hypothetical protein
LRPGFSHFFIQNRFADGRYKIRTAEKCGQIDYNVNKQKHPPNTVESGRTGRYALRFGKSELFFSNIGGRKIKLFRQNSRSFCGAFLPREGNDDFLIAYVKFYEEHTHTHTESINGPEFA